MCASYFSNNSWRPGRTLSSRTRLSDAARYRSQHRGGRGVPNLEEDAGAVISDLDEGPVPLRAQELPHPAHAPQGGGVPTIPQVLHAVPATEIVLRTGRGALGSAESGRL